MADESEAKADKKPTLWESVSKTDPAYTKQFDNGSFKGVAVDCLYNISRATEIWGPMGGLWGYEETEVIREDGCWWTKIRLWYPNDDAVTGDGVGHVTAWGATRYKYTSSKGRDVFDEDAPKKSATDAVAKALVKLGFSADVFMGKHSDNKYVAQLNAELHPPSPEETLRKKTAAEILRPLGELITAYGGWDAVKADFKESQGFTPNPRRKEDFIIIEAMVRARAQEQG